MQYYLEYVYNGERSGEPIGFSTLPELVESLLEWFQIVNYVARFYKSTSRVEQLISPNKLLMGFGDVITVFRIHSQYLSEDVIVWKS